MSRSARILPFFVVAMMLLGTISATTKSSPSSGAGREITNSIGMKFVRIPAGQFMMGSPLDELERESHEIQHPVSLTKSFYLGVTEVTQAQFGKLMDENVRAAFHASNRGGPDFPMENVLRVEADEFCRRLSELEEEKKAGRKYRLPTEAEWEFACRAGTTTPFYFGDTISTTQANFDGRLPYGDAQKGSYLRRTAKVASYEPNAFGLYDMHGNVAEWCADWYDPDYYANSPIENPLGPPMGVVPDDYSNFFLVARGGSWLDDARACRSAYRMRAMHRNRYWIIGFRVACDVAGDNE